MPIGSAANVKSFFTSITIIPAKDTISPKRFNLDNLSLRKRKAKKGVKTGIVAIITELMVEETSLSPKLSPKKYKNGLNSADNKNKL